MTDSSGASEGGVEQLTKACGVLAINMEEPSHRRAFVEAGTIPAVVRIIARLGIEPRTSCLLDTRSNRLSYPAISCVACRVACCVLTCAKPFPNARVEITAPTSLIVIFLSLFLPLLIMVMLTLLD